ncbi:hypothetical protein [Kordiimonas sp.]|uniref:hypothetical protein n=1 Tax=Kordiimonas sp. TaxID=1970157 RepID=UPI003A946860
MTSRSIERTVTFKNDFKVRGYKRPLPAGVYQTETEEVLLEGSITPAYRRYQTTLRLQPERPGIEEYLTLSPGEFDAAILRDHALAKAEEDKATEARTLRLEREAQKTADLLAVESGEEEGMLWMAEEPDRPPPFGFEEFTSSGYKDPD